MDRRQRLKTELRLVAAMARAERGRSPDERASFVVRSDALLSQVAIAIQAEPDAELLAMLAVARREVGALE